MPQRKHDGRCPRAPRPVPVGDRVGGGVAMLLQGLKVVEMSTWVAGPSCAAVLADWGAEVIKVESPIGDVTRAFFANPENGQSPIYANENRGKKGVVLDTTKPEG